MVSETAISLDLMLKSAREDIIGNSDEPLAQIEGMVVLPIRDIRSEVINYLAQTYFGKPLSGASTRNIEKQLKAIFEQAAEQLGYKRKRLSLGLNDNRTEYRLKVRKIMDRTPGRDNEYFLAPLVKLQ